MFHCTYALYLTITFQYTDIDNYIPLFHLSMLQLDIRFLSISYAIF